MNSSKSTDVIDRLEQLRRILKECNTRVERIDTDCINWPNKIISHQKQNINVYTKTQLHNKDAFSKVVPSVDGQVMSGNEEISIVVQSDPLEPQPLVSYSLLNQNNPLDSQPVKSFGLLNQTYLVVPDIYSSDDERSNSPYCDVSSDGDDDVFKENSEGINAQEEEKNQNGVQSVQNIANVSEKSIADTSTSANKYYSENNINIIQKQENEKNLENMNSPFTDKSHKTIDKITDIQSLLDKLRHEITSLKSESTSSNVPISCIQNSSHDFRINDASSQAFQLTPKEHLTDSLPDEVDGYMVCKSYDNRSKQSYDHMISLAIMYLPLLFLGLCLIVAVPLVSVSIKSPSGKGPF